MKSIPILTALFFLNLPAFGNYLANPSFESGLSSWSGFWSRNGNLGSVADQAYAAHSGAQGAEIVSNDSQDWSFTYASTLAVSPNAVFQYSAWMKSITNAGTMDCCVITYDSAGQVLDWMYADASRQGIFDWQQVQKTFVIPSGCAKIQFRFIGNGPCDLYVDDVDLEKIADPPVGLNLSGRVFSIAGGGTSLSFSGDTGKISMQKAGGRVFTLAGPGSGAVTALTSTASTLALTLAQGNLVSLTVSVDSQGQILFNYGISGALGDPFALPGALQAAVGLSWVLPFNEGLLVPADDPYFTSWDKHFYSGNEISMPFLGLTDGTEGIIYIIETPDDALAKFTAPAGSQTSTWAINWNTTRGSWAYPRLVRACLVESGGYVALAKIYRDFARTQGKLLTLRQKARTVAAVDRLIGAADWWWFDNYASWTLNYNCSALAAQFKAAGLQKILWSQEANPQAIRDMAGLGFLPGRYDNYQDVWDPATSPSWYPHLGWPGDITLEADGTTLPGWTSYYNGLTLVGAVICSEEACALADTSVRADLATHPYLARFLDTTTAANLLECFNAAHPLSRTADRTFKGQLLAEVSGGYRQVTGSETGADWAVPRLDYFEGMMSLGDYRLPNCGYDLYSYVTPTAGLLRFQTGPYYRIPLFELVYHDCVVSTWYWGDSSNRLPELWDDRDLFNALYGTMPLYVVDPSRWSSTQARLVKSYKTVNQVTQKVGYYEMVNHEFQNPDHTLQCTQFADGTTVCVNFGTAPATLRNGDVIAAKGLRMYSNANPVSGTQTTAALKENLDQVYVVPSPFQAALGYRQICFKNLTGHVTIRIFTIRGGLVLRDEADTPDGSYCWDLSGAGQGIASGVYLYVITDGNGGRKNGKIAIIK